MVICPVMAWSSLRNISVIPCTFWLDEVSVDIQIYQRLENQGLVIIHWPSKYPITCITRQHWMKSSKQTAWRPVLSNLRSRSRYTWGASSTFGGRFETLQPPVQEEGDILVAPEDWGCSQSWWEPAATRTGLLSRTCPWNQNVLSLHWSFSDVFQVHTGCFFTGTPLKS